MSVDTSPRAVAEDWAWRVPRYWALLAKKHGIHIARLQYASETSHNWPAILPQSDEDVIVFLENYPRHPQAGDR